MYVSAFIFYFPKYLFGGGTFLQNEITKQEELMGEIDRVVLRSEGTTVRHVLKIPEELFEWVYVFKLE